LITVSLEPVLAPIVKDGRMSTPTITEASIWINVKGSAFFGFHLTNADPTLSQRRKHNAKDMMRGSGISINAITVSFKRML